MPVNVMIGSGAPSFDDLAAAGVRRLSQGADLSLAVVGTIKVLTDGYLAGELGAPPDCEATPTPPTTPISSSAPQALRRRVLSTARSAVAPETSTDTSSRWRTGRGAHRHGGRGVGHRHHGPPSPFGGRSASSWS
jgi:hypothetical protein